MYCLMSRIDGDVGEFILGNVSFSFMQLLSPDISSDGRGFKDVVTDETYMWRQRRGDRNPSV